MRVVRHIIVLSTLSTTISAQAPTANRSADSAFARGDWAAAIAGYSALVTNDTVSPAPWMRLGIAHHSMGHYKEAVDALLKASMRGAAPTATELRLARAYAKLGDRTHMYSHLDSLVKLASLGVPPSAVSDEPDFAAHRDDAQFKSIVAKITAVRYPCFAMPEAQQLNFWVGEWDVAPWALPNAPRNAAGRNDVLPMLHNCLILENWSGAGGGEGKSMNFFEPSTRRWRQVWVADGGTTLDYAGAFKDGAMHFEGKTQLPNSYTLHTLTLTPFGSDTVRQTFEISTDSGKTWSVTFDARYVRRK